MREAEAGFESNRGRIMIRRLSLVVLTAAALTGCMTDGYSYRGGSGDYYYGRPSVDYYYDGYGYGYGYPGWYGGYDYRHGYGYGYRYPYHGWYGGYWDYPYYWPPYRPRPPRPGDDHDGPRTGGNLPPSRADGGPQNAGQVPRAIARPRLTEGVDPPVRRDPPGGLRRSLGEPRPGGSGGQMRVRTPATSAPLVPRTVAPPPRSQSLPAPAVRSMPRERISRPPASRERDLGQERER